VKGLGERVVAVTGGGQGIGKVIARRFADEGAAVAILEVDQEKGEASAAALRERGGGVSLHCTVDVTDAVAVERALVSVEHELGMVDVLINNAAFERYEPFLEIELESWRRHIDVDLTAVFITAQAVARRLVAAGRRGWIVNLASINSFGAEIGLAHYAAAKGGVANLTRAMALELAPHNILVNAVAPGPIATEKTAPMFAQPAFAPSMARIPLGRPGTADEVAGLCCFLASDDASFMSGSIVPVDGGYLTGL
jgi:NAD(P)-dependent dehydrogenase (short-subunit alcohol dehydrogenase family)